MAAVRRSRGEWCALVSAWARSGDPAEVFAAARGLNPGTLTWWRWKLGQEPEQAGFVRLVGLANEEERTDTLPRPRPDEVLRGLEIELPSGCLVRIGGAVKVEQVAALVQRLEG